MSYVGALVFRARDRVDTCRRSTIRGHAVDRRSSGASRSHAGVAVIGHLADDHAEPDHTGGYVTRDDVHAVGVALKLNDGTGPYAFNCGAPAFRFTEDRLRSDIGPRLVAMVRNIEAALGGAAPRTAQSKKETSKKVKSGGKVARVAEGIR